jgi:hypothetical protein
MDMKKLTEALIGFGIVITAGAVIWWAIFYSQVTKEMGGSLGDFFQCLFTSSGECSLVNFFAGLAGVTPYNPTLFWIGVIMLGTGVIIKFSLKKEDTP